MSFALVLGGGGVVGVAWEVGVLAGLADAGIDPASAELVVGTSAGSVVGTQLRQGRSIEALVAEQRESHADANSPPPTTDLTPLIEIFETLRSAKRRTPEVLREVGRKAIAAETQPEADWVGRFSSIVGEGDWPDRDLWITAVDCATGQRRVWTAADRVAIASAVAASCAIPGVFPPVTLDGSRYTDGGLWSSSNLDVVLDSSVDAAVFIGPLRAGDPTALRSLEREIEQVVAAGRRADAVVPGDAFVAEVGAQNLMNPSLRSRGVDLGMEDGRTAAQRIKELLG